MRTRNVGAGFLVLLLLLLALPVAAHGQDTEETTLLTTALLHVRSMLAPGVVAIDTARFQPTRFHRAELRAAVIEAFGGPQSAEVAVRNCRPRDEVPLSMYRCSMEGSGFSALIWPWPGAPMVRGDSLLVLVNTSEHAVTESGWPWIRGRAIAVILMPRADGWTVANAWTMTEVP